MRIVQANLCLRFYRSAGWTREAVSQLLRGEQRLAKVIPRYRDDRDKVTLTTILQTWEVDDGLPHDECEYFAVYGSCEPFCADALSEHEIV